MRRAARFLALLLGGLAILATVAYFVVPVVGLYFSLRSRFVLLSWLATLTACFALPPLLWAIWTYIFTLGSYSGSRSPDWLLPNETIMTPVAQLVLAGFLLWHLHAILVRRSFSFR